MHTESEIRRAVKPLLDIYGELNISEVKGLLGTVLEFDDEDNELSGTRKEKKILQRIGNLVSHQDEKIHRYSEGFVIDKTVKPSKFSLINPINKKVISNKEVIKKKEKRNKYKASIVDWDKIRERNNEIGEQGEEFIMEYEIDRLEESGIENSKLLVQHLSILQGDGLGYDVSSINLDGSTRYIEVKTTSGDEKKPFFMSQNERNFFKTYKEEAFVYRVYNFNRKTRKGDVKIISGKELFSDYIFDPISWKVSPK